MFKHTCYDPFRLCVHPVLGCGVNVIKGGYAIETALETEQRLWFLFSFLLLLSFLLPLCLHILELTPKYEKFKWSSMLAPSEQTLASQRERNPDISPQGTTGTCERIWPSACRLEFLTLSLLSYYPVHEVIDLFNVDLFQKDSGLILSLLVFKIL